MSSDDNPKLPHDVVVEILKRLPMESLLRFRCVCRSWRSAIDDPCFVNWHTVCLDWSDPVRNLCYVLSDESLTLPPQSQIEIPFGAPDSDYVIVGSCNGLICVSEFVRKRHCRIIRRELKIHLWNLFTRKHKVVRQPPQKDLSAALAFGFDARSNDYKIVKLPVATTCSRVEIYSLSTDSWRCMECEVPRLECHIPHSFAKATFFFSGNLHWPFYTYDHQRGELVDGSVLLFDVAGEVFDEMALPEELRAGNLQLSFAVLNRLFAVFVQSKQHSCSVWIMREYGVPESWSKLYDFEVSAFVTEFCGFARNGQLLMVTKGEGDPWNRVTRQVSWNPVTRQFENLLLSTKGNMINVVESPRFTLDMT